MVNRKEGRHLIERPGAATRPSVPRARSQSRERSALAPALRPNPPLQPPPPGSSPSRTERGRSFGTDGLRRLHGATPRSHSQGKLPSRTRSNDAISTTLSCREPQLPPSASGEELRVRQIPPSPRVGGSVLAKRQSASCSNSPLKGLQNNNNHSSPSSKKIITTPRPPAPRSPSLGHRRILPPVTSAGRRSPHSTPRNTPHHHHHHAASSRVAVQGPRSASRPNNRKCSSQENLQPQEGGESREGSGRGELGGLSFQMLPALDAQKEQDLYRSFEAEFLANTQQQVTGGGGGRGRGSAGLAPANSNVNDSAYSSSNSSSSSMKVGVLPDLRESRRASPCHLALDDPLHLLYGSNSLGPRDQWMELRGGVTGGGSLRKLPAISSSLEETDPPSHLMNQVPQRTAAAAAPVVHCGNMNGGFSAKLALRGQREEENLPLEEEEGLSGPGSLYNLGNGDDGESDELPPPETFPSPPPLPRSEEDCSFQDSSSSEENSSSMCFSLSESRSDSPQPPSPVANGDAHGDKGLSDVTTTTSKTDAVPHKHKPANSKMIRPRMDNRPDNGPSRIPTPLSYRDRQGALSPCSTPPASPQSSRSALGRRKTTCKILHQAFADLIGPQTRAPAVGSPDGPFPAHSASLDSDAWR